MIEQDLYTFLRETLVYLEFGGQQVLQTFDLTLPQYDTLRLLSERDGQRMGELRNQMLVDNSKMTRVVDHLVAQGLVERRQDPADRRAWAIFLTPAGRQLREQAGTAHRRFLQEQFAIFETSEQTQLAGLLLQLREHLTLPGEDHD